MNLGGEHFHAETIIDAHVTLLLCHLYYSFIENTYIPVFTSL
jgi:hypothetical protein